MPYETCCGVYHAGAEPQDAESLMRSRYAAFVRHDTAYLRRTLHPAHDDAARPLAEFEQDLRSHFASGVLYKRLIVHGSRGADASGVHYVLFTAEIRQRGRDLSFAELSSFADDGTGLRYVAGRMLKPAQVRGLSGPEAVETAMRL